MFQPLTYNKFKNIMEERMSIPCCDMEKLYDQYLFFVQGEIKILNEEYEDLNNKIIEIISKVMKFKKQDLEDE
jgi:hypothetical protein